ncbi:TrbM/KikA/MpfK family conjugal transfer protein [Gibbsiella quercinecans]|uniref:TrbM/KikA/MpfK family conjugal transfer protein n=1 Tax=Gibbsiella quercinecans TaxID=929813 RepID=UPI003A4E416B
MKKTVIAAALLCLAAGFSTPSFAAKPCEVVLCLYGKATGNGGSSECSQAEHAFFSINAFKKHHRFNPGKTFTMRRDFLAQCANADPAAVSQILSRFGRMRG